MSLGCAISMYVDDSERVTAKKCEALPRGASGGGIRKTRPHTVRGKASEVEPAGDEADQGMPLTR